MYAKDPYKPKYQYLMKKHGDVGLKYCKDPEAFMEYSNDMNDVYKSTEEYNPRQKRKILIVVDNMIADMISNNKVNPVFVELFIRGKA